MDTARARALALVARAAATVAGFPTALPVVLIAAGMSASDRQIVQAVAVCLAGSCAWWWWWCDRLARA